MANKRVKSDDSKWRRRISVCGTYETKTMISDLTDHVFRCVIATFRPLWLISMKQCRKVICVFVIADGIAAWLVLFRFFLTSVSGLIVGETSILPAVRGAWRRREAGDWWVGWHAVAVCDLCYSNTDSQEGVLVVLKPVFPLCVQSTVLCTHRWNTGVS